MEFENRDSSKKMGEWKVSRLLISYSLPVISAYLAGSIHSIISRAFIGNTVGPVGLAAVSLVYPITLIQMSFAFLLGMGGSTFAAIKVGEGDKELANKILNNSFLMIIDLGVVITIAGIIFIKEILIFLGASAEVLPHAIAYGRIMIGGCIFQMINLGVTNYMRVEGKTGLAMIAVLINPIVNIFFAWLFIMKFRWGVSGAAGATFIGLFISAGFIVIHFITNKDFFRLKLRLMVINAKMSMEIIFLGLSSFAIQFSQSLMMMVLNLIMKKYGGDVAVSGMGAVTTLQQFILTPVQGMNMGSQSLIGYNFGAKMNDRVKEILRKGIIITTVVIMMEYIVIWAFARQIVSIFNSDDTELLEFSRKALLTFLFMLPIIPLQVQGAGFFQAIRKPIHSMLLSMSRQVIVLIPILLILSNFYGIDGALYSGPISDTVVVMITMPLLIRHVKRLNINTQDKI